MPLCPSSFLPFHNSTPYWSAASPSSCSFVTYKRGVCAWIVVIQPIHLALFRSPGPWHAHTFAFHPRVRGILIYPILGRTQLTSGYSLNRKFRPWLQAILIICGAAKMTGTRLRASEPLGFRRQAKFLAQRVHAWHRHAYP